MQLLCCTCYYLSVSLKLIKASEGQQYYIPYFKVFTPFDIQTEAIFTTPLYSSVTGVSLTYGTGGLFNNRLFRLRLIPSNVLESDAKVEVVITVGLDREARSGDSDPQFFLSDGSSGIGFQMREEASGNRCRGIEALMGNTLSSRVGIPGATHVSTILPEEFVLTLKPHQLWGLCYNSADTGLISTIQFTRTLFPDRGLWLEVYREHSSEQFTFNYIKVEIHEH